MAIIKPNNNTLSSITALPAAISTGKVLQVQTTNKTDTSSFAIGDTNFVDVPGLSVNITPSSTSSKILVMATIIFAMNNNTYGSMIGPRLQRGSTAIGEGGNNITAATVLGENESTVYARATAPLQFLDSPSSTSQLTYKVTVKNFLGGDVTCIINGTKAAHASGSSNITVMEIAG